MRNMIAHLRLLLNGRRSRALGPVSALIGNGRREPEGTAARGRSGAAVASAKWLALG
jgi:hypothetical protein